MKILSSAPHFPPRLAKSHPSALLTGMPDQQGLSSQSGGVPLPGVMFDLGLRSSFILPRSDWVPPATETLEHELPQYEHLAFVARGGMGAVYRGRQKSLNRSVAIKILPQEISRSEGGFTDRFRREAEAMAHLSHPHIVSIFDAGESPGGLLYFVMEFIEGTDVQQLLVREGRLQPARALEITSMVCDALDFAHGLGVIHRDIKPSNVMLDQHSRTKVADFGLARLLGEDDLTAFTSSHLAMGTMNYLAPEALIPGTKLDHRVDLYSVGVMLYKMVTGLTPQGRFDMPSVLLPKVDRRIDSIIDRAMRMDRDKRYASAAEFKEEVNQLLDKPSGRVRPHGHAGSATVPVPKRHPGKKAAWAGVAALSVLAGAALLFIPKRHPAAERTQPAQSQAAAQTPSTIWTNPVPAYKDRLVLPTGVWIPVKLDKDFAAVNGGELTPHGGIKLSHGVILLDADHREFYARDVALRAHLLSTEHTTASSLVVRQIGPRSRKLVFAPHFTQLSNFPSSREAWSPPAPHEANVGLDDPVTLELVAIGRTTYGLVDGKPLPPIVADEPSEKGTVLIGSLDGEFRNVEVMILDGIPEEKAAELAGVKQNTQGPVVK